MELEFKRKAGRPPGTTGRKHTPFKCPSCGGAALQRGANEQREGLRGPMVFRWRQCRDCGARIRTRELIIYTDQDAKLAHTAFALVSKLLTELGCTEEAFDLGGID